MRIPRLVASFSLACIALPTFARTQCTTTWRVGDGMPGIDGIVFASTTWDPDGAGPMAPRIVYAGSFAIAGTLSQCGDVAMQDTVTGEWFAASSGTNGFVHCVVASPTGELVIGGEFTMVGGVPANNVAAWNGSRWMAVGVAGGIDGAVHALTFLATGDMVAGGTFTTAGGTPCSAIARWDGTNWLPYGNGAFAYAPTPPSVRSLLPLPNGDFVVGGWFASIDGVVAVNIARWSGGAWTNLAGGANDYVQALAAMPNGDLVAGGDFTSMGGVAAAYVARWNGTTWTPMAGTVAGGARVRALCLRTNGDLIAACGTGFLNGVNVGGVAQWNGSWTALGGGTNGSAYTVTTSPNGDLLAAGLFTTAGGKSVANAAAWNAASGWSPVTPGCNGKIVDLAVAANGDLIATGSFTRIGTVQHQGIARWNGATWSAVGASLPPSHAAAVRPNGTMLAGFGDGFRFWNGAAWGGLQGALGGVQDIVVMPNGDFVAGGNFTVAWPSVSRIGRCDGSTWSPLGSGVNAAVHTLLPLPDGSLVVGGEFTTAGGEPVFRIAKWDGTTWSAPFGLGFDNAVYALALLPNGDIVAGGAFTAAGTTPVDRIARWNGTSWAPLGSGLDQPVTSLISLPNGDLVAGGTFTVAGGVTASRIARWNGSSWAPCDGGVAGVTGPAVEALAFDENGDLAVGGDFMTAGSLASPYFARMTTSCLATAVAYGTGCSGPGGTLSLTTVNLPWSGMTFEVAASGLGAASFGLVMLSLGQILPGAFPINPGLLGVVPGPGVGCDLLIASLDYNEGLVPVAGVATWSLPLAPIQLDPTLPGLTFYLQVADLDFSAGWVGTNTTNGLTCTVGSF